MCLLLLVVAIPIATTAAEVLQVSSYSSLLIGDHNRTYSVKLACIDVKPEDEDSVKDWLKTNLHRKQRVNLFPQGAEDGLLLAKIKLIGSNDELNLKLVDVGLATNKCI